MRVSFEIIDFIVTTTIVVLTDLLTISQFKCFVKANYSIPISSLYLFNGKIRYK